MKAILTILISCFNAGDFLRECLESMAQQNTSRSLYKILFIDDASTDGSLELARSYAAINPVNFKILVNDKNKGLIKCCNRVLSEIETPYFLRLDADDWLSNDAVGKILGEIRSYSRQDFIVFKRADVHYDRIEQVDVYKDMFTWIAGGTAFATSVVNKVGGYSEEYWEEYDLYMKLLEAGCEYMISPHLIYYYRRGHESMTYGYNKKKAGVESLMAKWGSEKLEKYGNFEKVLKYYKI